MKKGLFMLTPVLFLTAITGFGQIITHPDTVKVYLYEATLVDVLVNDYEINNDSIYVVSVSDYQLIANRYIAVYLGSPYQGKKGRIDTVIYHVKQVNGTATATDTLFVDLINESFNVLDVNNLSARFNAYGNHFWDMAGKRHFYAPKNTSKSPTFSNAFWIAGRNAATNQAHLAAERYRQLGRDFFAGPVSVQYDSLYDRKWGRVWKLSTAQINYHLANYTAAGYTPIPDIADWPAHGDTTLGQLWQMAPFHDSNSNGRYEPLLGDYPLIRGDMSLFFVFNDARGLHTETGGLPLGVEVHGMAYGFNHPSDSMMYNTILLHYDVYNRSTYNYADVWMGIWNDFDLGFAFDDYIQTDVKNSASFCFNGTAVDGNGQPEAYGSNPPAFGMQILGGPYMDPDSLDNPNKDAFGNPLCDVSLNGSNFGDTIIDNERLGMSRAVYNQNIGAPSYMTDPVTSAEYINYMQGIWKDLTPMLYGGNGHPSTGAYGPACRYIFPGDSDSCLFGTGGVQPNGPVNWTEVTAGNQSHDRRTLSSCGPVTFNAGSRHELDLAFVFARDLVHNKPVDTLVSWFGRLKGTFQYNPGMFDPTLEVRSVTIPAGSSMLLFPNPSSHQITIRGLGIQKPCNYRILNLSGQITETGYISNGESIHIAHHPAGVYFLQVQTQTGWISRKFIRQ